ncbi:uncharacterized protein LOC122817774 isoform X3 [Drosophila biarmipes]|uniref:uncharacterized protein LOC122817774 isoform X3 n=1 Tax=Drosophila biarmipes TaxID=125945 RepID=UPI0021CCCB1B|nr:uncharacterized protein LOC122817774 isoform X3 [Drosophila biarmipes]
MNDCISILGGEFQLLRVTPALYDETEEILTDLSINEEFLCLTTNLKDSPAAIKELRTLIRHILSCGISFAIRQVASGRIVAALAGIIFNYKKESSYFRIMAQFKSPSMVRYRQLMDAIENSYDMYKEWKVDSIVEVEYLGTRPEFRGRGLSGILSQCIIRFGRLMSQGKLPPDVFGQLSKEMQLNRPGAICTIVTSPSYVEYAQRRGIQVAHRWRISELRSWAGNTAAHGDDEAFEYADLCMIKY